MHIPYGPPSYPNDLDEVPDFRKEEQRMPQGKPDLRIFIANAKSDDDARLAKLKSAIEIALIKTFPNRTPLVTLGRDDYMTHKGRCGSWDAWGRDVATGIHPTTREPRYHGIVVPSDRVGAATAAIVGQALGIAKPVLKWSETGGLTIVRSVVKVAERDFQNGWRVD